MSKDSVASGAVLTRTADVDVHIPLFIYNKALFVPVVELLTCFHPHQAFTLWGIFSFLSSKSKAGTSSDAKSATKEGCMELRLPLEESKLRSKFPAVDLATYNRVITAVADRRPRAAACKYIWLVSLQHAFIVLQAVVELLETGQTSNAAATARIGQVIAVMKRHASLHAFDAPKQNMEFLKHTSEQSPELLADTKRRIACLYNPASHPEQIINLILYNLQIFEGSWLKLWENVGGKFVFHPYSIVSGQMETNQAETSEDEQFSRDAEEHDCELLGLDVGSTFKAEAANMDTSRNTTIPETNATAVGTLKAPLSALVIDTSAAGGAAIGAASESQQMHKRSFSTISTTTDDVAARVEEFFKLEAFKDSDKLRDFTAKPTETSLKLAMNRSKLSAPANRGEAADRLLDLIMKRFMDVQHHDTRRTHPLIAAQSLPGGGKSFFLDCLASLRGRFPGSKWKEGKLPEAVQRITEALDSAVFVNIAFNGVQPINEPEDPSFAIAVRCLHSYFLADKDNFGQPFAEFAEAVRKDPVLRHLTLPAALSAIRQHADRVRERWQAPTEPPYNDRLRHRPVIIGVDEISKAAGLWQPLASFGNRTSDVGAPKNNLITTDPYISALLSRMGGHMDMDTATWFLVTSLDYLPEAITNSGRRVEWVPLQPINPIDVVLANQRMNFFANQQTGLLHNYQALRFLCDLGGHPRSIDIALEYVSNNRLTTYDRLLEHLVAEKDCRLEIMASSLSLDVLAPCILGEYLNFSPPKCFRDRHGNVVAVEDAPDYLSTGSYLNSISDVDPFQIPEASIVQLRLFCQDRLRRVSNPSVESPLVKSILQHLHDYCQFDVTTSTDGGYFERLARLRDVLVREFHTYRKTENLTLAHLIGIRAKPGPDGRGLHEFIPADGPNDEQFLWKKTDDVDPVNERVEIHRGPYEIRFLSQHVTPKQPLHYHDIPTTKPFAACIAADERHSQPGWDYLFVDSIQRPNSDRWEPHVLAAETRMSAPRPDGKVGTLELKRVDVAGKVASLSEQLEAERKAVTEHPHLEQRGASPTLSQSHVFYSHRQVAPDVLIPSPKSPKPCPRTIVFGREGVVKLFGPTLSKRHVFYRDLTEELRRRGVPASNPARSFMTGVLRLFLK